MVKFMKKLIPVMLLVIIVLAGIIVYLSVTRTPGPGPERTPAPTQPQGETLETAANTPAENTPSENATAEPAGTPADPTPSPEPSYNAVLKPYVTGEGSSKVTVTVKENLILAEYPYTANESQIASLKVVFDGENVAKADFQAEKLVPWQTEPG